MAAQLTLWPSITDPAVAARRLAWTVSDWRGFPRLGVDRLLTMLWARSYAAFKGNYVRHSSWLPAR
ncbi:hypothetical protein [Streptomyces sp. NPDC012466]|uniref:hypothetical protein n=1 Tax=Streptomyces sp. NPDC012466 TaxID=3364835 RepID=UPI0036F10542